MQVKFWGVRGSTPTPQPENMRYGGNTPCVEVRLNGRLYIFDCGTGFRNLGKHLAQEQAGQPIQAHVFISHYHWDHIQGIPFFVPLYDPRNQFDFHSSSQGSGLQDALEGQMVKPYFPVNMTAMAAKRQFYSLEEGWSVFEDCRIQSRYLNHPQGCLGFRVETPKGCLVYATDNEPGDPALDRAVRELAEGADVLIYDAQYLPDEYVAKRRGWGHSHWREGIDVALASGAKQLVLFHHDPDRSDACLDAVIEEARSCFPQVCAASEGLELEF